ncbi:putative glutathione-specific gamma-glutamylcyclotransferase 2 [Amphibalanus amphitrite]|uniref:glutathione-specific gamma-glutamylcyclotransferase n=1 Tax=Amphibalanus amphitrite TaxID=1232801 RepID=A0A6A4VDB7_AMPAM|nr:putative glutathione-specific gamma-glutamylcyclotransferase 2 [Amphibalanus amphitrite]
MQTPIFRTEEPLWFLETAWCSQTQMGLSESTVWDLQWLMGARQMWTLGDAGMGPSEMPSRVWGVAYELDEHHPDAAAARDRLTHRERWFEQRRVPFWRATSAEDASDSPLAQQSLVLSREVELFIATSEGPNFLGDAPPEQLAREIAEPRGPSGTALEYFQRVLEFQRGLGPEARDEHLEMLAPLVERAAAELAEKGLGSLSGTRQEARVWGVAYEIPADEVEATISHLDFRERCGYERRSVAFHPQDERRPPHRLTIYVGTEDNPYFTGPTSEEELAAVVVEARGMAGPNTEYIYNLAEAVRTTMPHVKESHLFILEEAVRKRELQAKVVS